MSVAYWAARRDSAIAADLLLTIAVKELRKGGATKAADAVARARKSVQGARNHARGQHGKWRDIEATARARLDGPRP